MPESRPTLFVCHGDDGGPRVHPCRRVQEALRAKGIEYDKVIAAHGSPIPFLRKGSREELREATGDTKLPALKLPDGTVLTHSRAILSWNLEARRRTRLRTSGRSSDQLREVLSIRHVPVPSRAASQGYSIVHSIAWAWSPHGAPFVPWKANPCTMAILREPGSLPSPRASVPPGQESECATRASPCGPTRPADQLPFTSCHRSMIQGVVFLHLISAWSSTQWAVSSPRRWMLVNRCLGGSPGTSTTRFDFKLLRPVTLSASEVP